MCSSISRLIDRVRAEFVEMPGLELSLPQAARLWNLSLDDSRNVLDVLTTAGFLRWTPSRTVVRTGRNLVVVHGDDMDDLAADISVVSGENHDKTVWIR